MAYHIVGLDIGSRNVRALLFERSFRGGEVVEVREEPLPLGVDGAPPSQDEIQATINKVVGDLNRGQSSFVAGFPGARASVWFFRMPFNDPKRIAQTVHFEVEDMVPFDLEDMLFSYRIQRDVGEAADLMATLAPRKEIGEKLAFLQEGDINPIALLLDAQALGNALPTQSSDPQVIVDVGHRRTLISVVRDGIVEHVQSLPGGGQVITEALMEAWDLPFEVAEYLKHNRALPPGFSQEGEPEGGLSSDSQVEAAEDSPDAVTQPEEAAARLFESAGETIEGELPKSDDDNGGEYGNVTTLSWSRLGLEEQAPDLQSLDNVPGYGTLIGENEVTPTGRLHPHYKVVAESIDGPNPGSIEETTYILEDVVGKGVLGGPSSDGMPALGPIPMGGEGPQTGPVTADAVQEIIDASLARMIQPIRGSLIAYEVNSRRELMSVALAGGSSALPELPEILAVELGITVHPIGRFGTEQMTVPGTQHPEAYALAFALGLRGITDGRLKEVDFRREEFASRSDIHRVRVFMAIAMAAVFLLAIMGTGYSVYRYQELSSEAQALEAKILSSVADGLGDVSVEELGDPTEAINSLMVRQMELDEDARILNVMDPRPPTALQVLRQVSEHLAPGDPGDEDFLQVDIDEYQAGESSVRLKGYTKSFDATGQIEASLKKSELFKDVTLGDVTSARGKDERKNFSLTFTIEQDGVVGDES